MDTLRPSSANDEGDAGREAEVTAFVDRVQFDKSGLVPAIAQQWDTSEVLMMAWMSRESLIATVETGAATYFSRSRQELWRKGDTSGHTQAVREIRIDCDADALLMEVDQNGPACHTGLRSCFDSGSISVASDA